MRALALGESFSFVVYGRPTRQRRGQPFGYLDKAGKVRGRINKPKANETGEAYIRTACVERMQALGMRFPAGGALRLDCVFAFAPPKSKRFDNPAKQKPDKLLERGFPSTRSVPDVSNTLKQVEDALNAVAYEDDSQICQVWAEKGYTLGPERMEITLTVLEWDPLDCLLCREFEGRGSE